MRRLLAILGLVLVGGVFGLLATGAGNDSSGDYKVRAIFRNAFSVIPGEDVKIAGVKVGKIDSLDVTPQQTAAVVLDITRDGFKDFRSDARCTIRPQSLIGEKFVECTPTAPRAPGARPAPALKKITSGKGKGQYLLPVTNTDRPVDIDLVGNIMRLPYRERLSIILNEFGAAVAGRGRDLRSVIRNADPALKQTDRVLQILGDQNRALRRLALNSDAIMAPLARDRAQVAAFIGHANTVAQATAERGNDFERDLHKLPAFLTQLSPTMRRLGGFSDQLTPLVGDLGSQASSINRLVRQLGPFSRAGIPALTKLGDASVVGRTALVKSKPIVGNLKTFASTAKPLSKNLRALLQSIHDTGGVERLMDYIFYQVAAINGFDQYGHYLRAQLVVNLCSTYAVEPDVSCSANFQKSGTTRSATQALAAKNAGRTPALAREDALLRGMSLDRVLGRDRATRRAGRRSSGAAGLAPIRLPSQVLPGQQPPASAGPAPATTSPSPTAAGGSAGSAVQSLLDYLLG